MSTKDGARFNRKQLIFKDIVLGTLIWACVLGFFSDYTDIVYTKSFSYLFLAAFVLEILVFLTLLAKKQVFSRFSREKSFGSNALVVLGTWLILFLSKFAFIGAIDLLFAGTVTVYGFFNIMIVVLIATVVQRLAEYVFVRLGDNRGAPATDPDFATDESP